MELEPPLVCDHVRVPKRVSIGAVAKALEIPADQLRKLNPALTTSYTPPDYPDFELNVPEGMAIGFDEKLAAIPEAELKADPEFSGRYKVRPGETLSEIAAHYRVPLENLKLANNISSPKSLRAGAILRVPEVATARRTAGKPAAPAGSKGSHQIKSGETLTSIAQQYGVTVAALQEVNRMGSATTLRSGEKLKVPAMATAAPAPVEQSAKTISSRRHQVKSGDTLYSISILYGVPVEAIRKANGIRSPRSLQVGQWLQIPPSSKKG